MEKHTPFGSFFSEVGGGEGSRCNYPVRLDTYGCGCQHDCAYCYAKSLLDFRNRWNPEEPAVASAEYVRRKLDRVKPGTVLRLGGMTDCFMPQERVYRATYQALKMLNARGIHYLIVTKSALVSERDYLRVIDPELAHVQLSVTSTSDEPNYLREKASPPSERIAAAERLQAAGVDVSLRVSPYIPDLVDLDVLNRVKVSKCLVEFLRVNHWVERWTGMGWPEHTLSSGGYRHLPLSRKVEMLGGFKFGQLSVCEDVPEHYDWFRANVNANPDDCCNIRREHAGEAEGGAGTY